MLFTSCNNAGFGSRACSVIQSKLRLKEITGYIASCTRNHVSYMVIAIYSLAKKSYWVPWLQPWPWPSSWPPILHLVHALGQYHCPWKWVGSAEDIGLSAFSYPHSQTSLGPGANFHHIISSCVLCGMCYILHLEMPKVWGYWSTLKHPWPLVYSLDLASIQARASSSDNTLYIAQTDSEVDIESILDAANILISLSR